MIQFSKQELITMLGEAHRAYQAADEPDGTNFNGNEIAQHMAMLSIAQSMLVIADSLTAIRFESRSSDVTRIADNINDLYNAVGEITRRLP